MERLREESGDRRREYEGDEGDHEEHEEHSDDDGEEDYDYRLDIGSDEDRYRESTTRGGGGGLGRINSNFSSAPSSLTGGEATLTDDVDIEVEAEHAREKERENENENGQPSNIHRSGTGKRAAIMDAIHRGQVRFGGTFIDPGILHTTTTNDTQHSHDGGDGEGGDSTMDQADGSQTNAIDSQNLGSSNPQIQGMLPEEHTTSIQDEIHAQMSTYVDPGETDGMPSLPQPELATFSGGGGVGGEQEDIQAQASALVKAHQTGRFGGILRNRKGIKHGFGLSGKSRKHGNGKTGDLEKNGNGNGGLRGAQVVDAEKQFDAFAARYPDTDVEDGNGRPGQQPGSTRQRQPMTPTGIMQGVGKGAGRLGGAVGAGAGRLGGVVGAGAGKFGGAMGAGANKFGMGAGKFGGAVGAGALAGGGVLASLLALNAEPQTHSGVSTPASSRPPSIMLSDEDSSEDERFQRERERRKREKREKERRRQEQKETERKQVAAAKQLRATTANNANARRVSSEKVRPGWGLNRPRSRLSETNVASMAVDSSPPTTGGGGGGDSIPRIPTPTRSLTSPTSPVGNMFSNDSRSKSQGSLPEYGARSASPSFMQGIRRAADRMGVDLNEHERPKAARNGGGVFGALVQSTGNLSAVGG